MRRLWVCGLLILWGGCHPDKVRIEGKVTDVGGEVKLLTVSAAVLDTVVIARAQGNAGFSWEIAQLNFPVRVWLEVEGKAGKTFVIDGKEDVQIEGSWDSLAVYGGELEREYEVLKNYLKKNYQDPADKIEESIKWIVKRTNRNSSDNERLKRLVTLRERYRHYRYEYVKKLIRTNPSHELSLLLVEEELKDSIELQRQLFRELEIPDRKSDLYRVLEKKLQQ